ncbi:hypothetical protein EEL32_21025 [Brevibacillus laterosporus]|uniref:Uncharacterized protein n=1 Tax=Brevibacillus laterosporus TaxID=1465 RepID=A0A502I2P3_BRELA|nr:hypothetical protein [Brevibacillus laterosporus]QDX92302.1 hypothetical protein EEL30_07995 [Brevibacillus laterosporus]RAP25853.1 hypothetical protein C2W64_02327 [Brevibacillus laterosporus]TPG70611.1 hypothetical protein EEL31_20455 [Brevibacillus laterosporus]TPG80244.1 hypothetical protein EEL32_21025 [Brevibacillus laterosporus]
MTRKKIAGLFLLLALIINTLAVLTVGFVAYSSGVTTSQDIMNIFFVYNTSGVPFYFILFIIWLNNNEQHHYQE